MRFSFILPVMVCVSCQKVEGVLQKIDAIGKEQQAKEAERIRKRNERFKIPLEDGVKYHETKPKRLTSQEVKEQRMRDLEVDSKHWDEMLAIRRRYA